MKRALYEWSAYAFCLAGLACFGFGFASWFRSEIQFELIAEAMVLEMRGSDGHFVFSNCLANVELLDDWSTQLIEPKIDADAQWGLPGIRHRRMSFSDQSVSWYVRLSAFLPGVLFSLIAVMLWRGYRRARLACFGAS